MNQLLESKLKHHRNHLNDKNTCFLYKEYIYNKDNKVTYSVIVPVYNQEKIIIKNIEAILKHTFGLFELIIILDFCNDNSEQNLLDFFNHYTNKNIGFYGVRLFKQENSPIFEASCDNIGFINSYGDFCLEIQSDMEMQVDGYNLKLSKPFTLLNNVFAVSGRCAHNLFGGRGGVGKLGVAIEKPIEQLEVDENLFYVYETCNRGPILFCRKKLEEINFLNEKKFYLDNSDHDAIVRAYLHKGYISGYVPIDFSSPLQDGSTRKKEPKNAYQKINQKYKKLRKRQGLIEKYLNNYPILKRYSHWIPNWIIFRIFTSSMKKPTEWKSKEIINYDIKKASHIL